jgi:hypothetical protein
MKDGSIVLSQLGWRFALLKGPLIEAPAFLFAEQEYEDLVSFVTLGVLFLWDVHVVATKARRQLFYSHDEVVWIEA